MCILNRTSSSQVGPSSNVAYLPCTFLMKTNNVHNCCARNSNVLVGFEVVFDSAKFTVFKEKRNVWKQVTRKLTVSRRGCWMHQVFMSRVHKQ
jgi:hypothetical protein